MAAPTLSRAEFEARFRALAEGRSAFEGNDGCVACERCRGCSGSTFCKDGERLVRCHYCVASSECTDCSHCRACSSCLACTHCSHCDGCTQSAYLVRCVGLSGCSYCFGCVGLRGKDFHILNEPYDRSTYFAIVEKLSRELGL